MTFGFNFKGHSQSQKYTVVLYTHKCKHYNLVHGNISGQQQ